MPFWSLVGKTVLAESAKNHFGQEVSLSGHPLKNLYPQHSANEYDH